MDIEIARPAPSAKKYRGGRVFQRRMNMTDEQIMKMLADITLELDYDLWKEAFNYYEQGNKDLAEFTKIRESLLAITRKHIPKT